MRILALLLVIALTLGADAVDVRQIPLDEALAEPVVPSEAVPSLREVSVAPVPLAPEYPAADFADKQPFCVNRVVDGDTIEVVVGGALIKVRLVGVDTPELRHGGVKEQPGARAASDYVTGLLTGEQVYVVRDPKAHALDKYGRLLANVYRYPDGLWLNLELVRGGYGKALTLYKFSYPKLFVDYQARAQAAHKGLWVER